MITPVNPTGNANIGNITPPTIVSVNDNSCQLYIRETVSTIQNLSLNIMLVNPNLNISPY